MFEVIQANLENIHLLRCALSLLVIIITLLRRKLPDPTANRESSVFFPHPGSVATADSIGAWVVDTLARIGDASAVSICVNVLITSYNPSVQELALSLLASILMVSDEAVTQMLLPYTPTGTAVPVDSSNDSARRNSNNRRASVSVSVDSLLQAEAQAQEQAAPKVDFKKLNFSYNTMDYSVKKVVHEKPKKSEKNSTCLSYVLSVILLQKNRHLLAAGCADIILAMLRKNKRDMSESIAMSCTCELPAIDDRKGKNENRSSLSKLSFNAQPEENSPHSCNPLSSVILEWAGLKLMLKFLFRYEKMSAQSKTATKAIVRESVSASLHLKEEYAYAHAKVFTAVCQLIANSPVVATYTNTLAGAEDLLNFTYHRFDPADETHRNTLAACRSALNEDKEMQQRRRAQAAFMRDHPHELVHPMPGDPRLEVYIRDPTYVRSSYHASDPSRGTTRTPGSSVSPSKNTSLGHRLGHKNKKSVSQSLDAGRGGRLGTGPRTEVQHQSIELTRNFKVNFQSEYEVETEKRELYLLNSYDSKYGTNSQTDLKKLSKDADRLKAQTPLSYHPNDDMLLDSSLERIGSTALKPITVPRSTPLTEQQRRESEFLLRASFASGQPSTLQHSHELSAFHSTASSVPSKSSLLAPPLGQLNGGSIQSSNDSSSYPGRMMRADSDNEMIFRSSQDFFGALRHKPVIPLRIEPKDVIQEGEPLHLIQKKFAKLAEEAKSRGESKLFTRICSIIVTLVVLCPVFVLYQLRTKHVLFYLLLQRVRNPSRSVTPNETSCRLCTDRNLSNTTTRRLRHPRTPTRRATITGTKMTAARNLRVAPRRRPHGARTPAAARTKAPRVPRAVKAAVGPVSVSLRVRTASPVVGHRRSKKAICLPRSPMPRATRCTRRPSTAPPRQATRAIAEALISTAWKAWNFLSRIYPNRNRISLFPIRILSLRFRTGVRKCMDFVWRISTSMRLICLMGLNLFLAMRQRTILMHRRAPLTPPLSRRQALVVRTSRI